MWAKPPALRPGLKLVNVSDSETSHPAQKMGHALEETGPKEGRHKPALDKTTEHRIFSLGFIYPLTLFTIQTHSSAELASITLLNRRYSPHGPSLTA